MIWRPDMPQSHKYSCFCIVFFCLLKVQSMWEQLTNGQKLILGIVATNMAVWGAWRVKSVQPFMLKFFTSVGGREGDFLFFCYFFDIACRFVISCIEAQVSGSSFLWVMLYSFLKNCQLRDIKKNDCRRINRPAHLKNITFV